MSRDIIRDHATHYGLLIWGRRIDQEALKRAGLTEARIRELADFVRGEGDALVYAHQGTTINWENDDAIPTEHGDAIVGRGLAVATNEAHPVSGAGGATLVERSELEGLDPVDPSLWARIRERFGVAPSDSQDQVYLAVGGWSVAELWDGVYVYDADCNDFELAEDSDEDDDPDSFEAASAADEPGGTVLNVSELPEKFWLSSEYL